MILSDVRNYIRDRGKASVADVARYFGTTPDAVRPMLDVWVNKGKIHTVETRSCDHCCQCDTSALEIYVWGQADTDTPDLRICEVKIVRSPL